MNYLDVIIFADETVTSLWTGTAFHPVVITLGNIPIKFQAMNSSKLTIGYIPILKGDLGRGRKERAGNKSGCDKEGSRAEVGKRGRMGRKMRLRGR